MKGERIIERRRTMKRGNVVGFTLSVLMLLVAFGCNPSVGIIVMDTIPQGATVFLNETKAGETPVKFEFDMDKPVMLKIIKEGYKPKTESINVNWVRSEYNLGHYGKGKFMINGEMQKGFEIHTLRELIRAEGN
jgi:hypothetical protein